VSSAPDSARSLASISFSLWGLVTSMSGVRLAKVVYGRALARICEVRAWWKCPAARLNSSRLVLPRALSLLDATNPAKDHVAR
jgi:hypothetical protein